MAPTQYYDKDEKVLCFHHEMLYEAKVLDVRPEDKNDKRAGFQYLVHYKGWKNTWDDWVPQDRLRKFSEENLELAKNLKKEIDRVHQMNKTGIRHTQNMKTKKGTGSARLSEDRSTPQLTAGKKRVRDADTEKIDEWRDKPQIRLPFPDILKSILVDDWENVTWLNQMVSLPSKHSVAEMLDDYQKFAEPSTIPDTLGAHILEEVTVGLREYFNLALGRLLLYKQERRQYAEWRKRLMDKTDPIHKDGEKTIHDIYGAEHFLRLMTMMPELVAQTNVDTTATNRLREELINFLMWTAQKDIIKKYFSVPYVDNHHLEEHERNGPHKHEPSAAAGEA